MELKTHNKFLSSLLNITKSFTKQHPEILFTKADKGNTTVILNKDDYINKMTVIRYPYLFHHDPTKKLSQDLRVLITRWKNKQFIDMHTYRKLHTTDGLLPSLRPTKNPQARLSSPY